MREGLAEGARPGDMRAIEAAIAARAGRTDDARRLLHDLGQVSGLTAGGLLWAATAAVRVGELDSAARFLLHPLTADLTPTMARL
ncbi:MAG: hypothetical protein E6K78_08575, partial [Candidatus Eisenbacteria bacterium]